MKSTRVHAAAALLALAAACSKKEEPKPSETNTTSAPMVDRDENLNRPVEVTGGTVTTGSATDPGNSQGGGAITGTTESSQGAGAGGTTGSGSTNSGSMTGTGSTTGSGLSGDLGHDAGIASDSVPMDRQGSKLNTGTGSKELGTSQEHVGQRNNKSTSLGDGTSGQYTGGKGTYGGKATHGTGDKNDSNAKSNTNTDTSK